MALTSTTQELGRLYWLKGMYEYSNLACHRFSFDYRRPD